MLRLFGHVFFFCLLVGLAACAGGRQLSEVGRSSDQCLPVLVDEDFDEVLPWEEIVSETGGMLVPRPGISFEVMPTPDKLAGLHPSIRRDNRLASLSLSRLLRGGIPFDRGVYGKVGSAVMYVSTTDRIPDWDRLYWVMVRVLSEKYGCFLASKMKEGNVITIGCRDGRRVVFWRSRSEDWIQFYARQFDREGRELVVENRQVLTRRVW